MGRIDFDDLQAERSYSGSRAYNQSKLANLLFSYELARRLPGTTVTANALHPGMVSTSFGAEDPASCRDWSSCSSSERSYDEAVAARLWQVSADLSA